MQIIVIGHSVLDHIHFADSFRFQPGGIFYSALALASLKKEEDEYELCTAIEDGVRHIFEPAFKSFSLTPSMKVERIPRVHLTVFAESERCERFENINTPLEIPDTDFSGYDAILINMISGFDITLEDLKKIEGRSKGIIYFDVHSLARGVGETLVREFRAIENFSEWAKHLTFVQANENEILTLSAKTDEQEIASEILNYGVRGLIVTKGEKGASIYYLVDGEVDSIFIAAPKLFAKNKVGCGDVFGAYFLKYYLETRDLVHSLRAGVLAGSMVTQLETLEQFGNVSDEVKKRLE